MKIICPKTALMQGVNIVLKAVPARSTMPVLECILIHTEQKKIILTGNDMELGIETIVSGDVIEEGSIALEAKLFADIVRKLPDNDVTLETDPNYHAKIRCEKARFQIPGRSGDDFARLPEVQKEHKITLSQFMLKEMIRQTSFALEDSSQNSLLTGEYFEVQSDTLRVVAMDGHRVAIRKTPLKEAYESFHVIVPGKTLNEVGKILPGDMDAEVQISFTQLHIVFLFEDTTVVSRLIEGKYFDIDRMTTTDYETKISVNKKMFQESIERAALLIRESDKQPLILDLSDHILKLGVVTQLGSMNDELDVLQEGHDIRIGFDAKYFLDVLRVIDDEEIDLYLMNAKSPCYIRNEDGSYNYLVLPIRIR